MLRLSRRMYTETHIRIQTHTHTYTERELHTETHACRGQPKAAQGPSIWHYSATSCTTFLCTHTCTRTYACVQLYVCVLSVVRVRKKRN